MEKVYMIESRSQRGKSVDALRINTVYCNQDG